MPRCTVSGLALLLLAPLAVAVHAPFAHATDVDYATDIKPLLAEKCGSCHGVLRQESGLRLDTQPLMVTGGDSGAAVVPGDPDGSLLLERVTATDDLRMPPPDEGSALTAQQTALLRQWISGGAMAPPETAAASPLDHWAFQPIVQPAIPPAADHPIDALLGQHHQAHGLRPQPPVERSLLIRRLYLDLIGLPPTRAQLNDARPVAAIVEELLHSPHHGERWGRHWMDVWRYSDWYGLNQQLRNSQKHMWHWRDWIVNSLNADKAYDRMIHEMLAGDELAPLDPEVVAGTGFLARNYYLFNRTTWLDATIEHTGKAFLGLTLNCAKCHDHKYDPVSQQDYYQFRALLEPHQVRLDPIPGTDLAADGLPRVFDGHLTAPTRLHRRGNPKDPDPDLTITPQVPAIFADFQPAIREVTLPAAAWVPAIRPEVFAHRRQQAEDRLTAARQALMKARPAADARPPEPFSFRDDFSMIDESVWQVVGPWRSEDGHAVITQPATSDRRLQLKKSMPADFELSCRYITTGGQQWKSIVFRFDESHDHNWSNAVYTSAHAPQPKIQVSHTRNGQTSYPAQGRQPYPVRLHEICELRVAVRNRLVNVWLNGEFQLAYLLPSRQTGTFSIAAFDASVAIDEISVNTLPTTASLTPAGNDNSDSAADADTLARWRQADFDVARREREAVLAIHAAEVARRTVPRPTDTDALIQQAATAQAEARLAKAARAEQKAGADSKRQAAAAADRKRAEQQLAAATGNQPHYDLPVVSQQALEGPDHKASDYAQVYPSTSTGRRLSLARWMTSPQNPLTARVAVNHVWMRHFGEPLVESVFDFGLRAKQPVQQQLLDYLAADFMAHGWSFRHLHRRIVLSAAYQRSSSIAAADARTLAVDPDNHYLWRMNARRMEAQIVRDSLLHLSGTLDTTFGGPPVDVNGGRRRSLYFRHSRDDRDKFLSMFDDADLLQCYRRSESIVPQQALALANSELSLQAAARIAAQLESLGQASTSQTATPEKRDSPDTDEFTAFVTDAFFLLLGRQASAAEQQVCRQFHDQLKQRLTDNRLSPDDIRQRIRTRLIHSLQNHNDFVTIR